MRIENIFEKLGEFYYRKIRRILLQKNQKNFAL